MPQEGFWLHWLDSMPAWFYPISAIFFLILLAAVIWWLGLGAKRLSDTMGRENRIITLQEELYRQRDAANIYASIAAQVSAALAGAQAHVTNLNRLRCQEQVVNNSPGEIIRQILETLALDIKHRSGERHRCGLWTETDGVLVLTHASSGFPPHYIGERRLTVSRSAAGQVYRFDQTRKWDDVRSQAEWEENPSSNSPFKALIGIPVHQQMEVIGVVTIDGIEPMTDQDQAIGELYTALIENAAYELTKAGIMEAGQGG